MALVLPARAHAVDRVNGTVLAPREHVFRSPSLEKARELAGSLSAVVDEIERELKADEQGTAAKKRGWVSALRADARLLARLLDSLELDRVGLSTAVLVREEGKKLLALLEGEVARRDDSR